MKITHIDIWPETYKLKNPFTIAYSTLHEAVNIFIRLETDTHLCGFGSAGFDEEVTGETHHTILKALKDIAVPHLLGKNPLRYKKILAPLEKELKEDPTALAAVDMALYDIIGKKADLPLWILLGGWKQSIKTSVTIGIMPPAETVKAAQEWLKQGFTCLKLKGGQDLAEDIEKTLKVREIAGKQVGIRFDANQGYSVDQAIHYISATEQANLEAIEQPTKSTEPLLLGSVSAGSHIPVMADESLLYLKDAFYLARKRLVDMVNIKLMKVGGIAPALQVNAVARSAGQKVMVGCMDEPGLGIAAGLHFTLSQPNIAYADLDGHLDLIDDPTKDAVIIKQGFLYTTDKPGLGFDLE